MLEGHEPLNLIDYKSRTQMRDESREFVLQAAIAWVSIIFIGTAVRYVYDIIGSFAEMRPPRKGELCDIEIVLIFVTPFILIYLHKYMTPWFWDELCFTAWILANEMYNMLTKGPFYKFAKVMDIYPRLIMELVKAGYEETQ
ncbi:hypothetical protein DFJ63DRAFT_336919 [Scheffersomyces coipomensis]|uniref:uncharacterized protein n=1 Tax=Scheffersomyces coipomensis TaxID=1788519 RepID=UPI00315DB6EA